jgi:uncharacterized membrane protein
MWKILGIIIFILTSFLVGIFIMVVLAIFYNSKLTSGEENHLKNIQELHNAKRRNRKWGLE